LTVTGERAALLGVLVLGGIACILGAADPPSGTAHVTAASQATDVIRVVTTTALAVALLLGPGVVTRALGWRRLRLGFIALPGLAILATTAGLAWVMAGSLGSRWTCAAVLGCELAAMFGVVLARRDGDLLSAEERRTLALVSLPLGLAIARSLWSLGPAGELYAGTISRTLVAEPRPDSRISYVVSMLVAHGTGPYSRSGAALFAPYSFSSRGPVPGLAAAPIMLLTGAQPGYGLPDAPWQPFDLQGFMAYRIAMMTFSCTVFLSLWELVRSLAGGRAARFAVLLAITTPFVLADLWYTWPKLLAASFVLLGAVELLERRPFRGGLLVAVGYLMHPSGLLSLVVLGPIALWPFVKTERWAPRRLVPPLLLLASSAIIVELWRRINGPDFNQNRFLDYFAAAYPHSHPTFEQWILFRLSSFADTLVPLYLPLFESHSWFLNFFGGISPRVVHFLAQYWMTVPFGFGITFFPLLLISLWRVARRWPWQFAVAIAWPLLAFGVYWGASITGLLREGMQAWVFVVLAAVAVEQASVGFLWMRSRGIRLLLVLRPVELLALAVGATLGTQEFKLIASAFSVSDAVAVGGLMVFSGLMIAAVWRETAKVASGSASQD